jgi:ABC-type multidrug transport system ATPase subunit
MRPRWHSFLHGTFHAFEIPFADSAVVSSQVMTVVKNLVNTGITICATIHSPTPYSFNLFDTLMILLRGNVVYFGKNGGSSPRTKLFLQVKRPVAFQ